VLPEGFKKGETAKSTLIQLAAEAGVKEWREVGHAKAKLTGQDITANHDTARLNAVLTLSPGPKLRFGNLRQTTQNAVRSERIARIAGLPTGEVFSPAQLDKVAKRLRRTGAFSSVTLSESDTVSPNDTLDIGLALVDQKPRRFGGGAEVSSLEGLKLSAFWMHRNAFGGGERFRIDGEVKNIKGQHGGVDYLLSARLDQPATFGADTNGFIFARATYEDEPHYLSRSIDLGVGMTRLLSDNLELELGGAFRYSETTDVEGDRRFFLFTLPSALTWDNRDSQLDARSGMYIKAKATPFISLDTGGLGAWLHSDLRAYQQLGTSKDFILAGRVQVGSVFAQNYGDIPPDYLFYSGGGGSVRGQPYQSLGQTAADGSVSGGASFVSVSAELRAKVTNTIGVVGFVDAGQVTSDSFLSGQSEWHAGAGVGLRYQTPLGPLRFDVATPILGDTGDGVQLYLGIGQAF
jgi:translocation and assembly module TamA